MIYFGTATLISWYLSVIFIKASSGIFEHCVKYEFVRLECPEQAIKEVRIGPYEVYLSSYEKPFYVHTRPVQLQILNVAFQKISSLGCNFGDKPQIFPNKSLARNWMKIERSEI